MKKPEQKTVVAKVPATLLKKIDAAARKSDRTRSAEMRFRLEASFSVASDAKRITPVGAQ
ncbi:MAG: hypothetical protein K2W93_17800 [Burkholderiaceae bacterium]|nr:hypothetical protein [Burkholderiaceae bacterium]